MSKKQLLFSAKGRISRRDYWAGYLYSFLFFLLPVLIVFAFYAAIPIIDGEPPVDSLGILPFANSYIGKALAALIWVPLLLCYSYTSFCVAIKRLHDLNHSGWFSLYRVVPTFFITFSIAYGALNLIAFVITIIIGSARGNISENKYGANLLAEVN